MSLTDSQIKDIAKKMSIPLGGVFFKDELPKLEFNKFYMVNLEDSENYLGNAGINTTAVQTTYECDIGGQSSTLPVSTLFFSNHDCIYSINSDGIMSVSW